MTSKTLHEACKLLNQQFNHVPIVYGSLCLSHYIENHLGIKDIDLLLPIQMIDEQKEALISAFKNHGFDYIETELLTFRKDNVDVEIARLEDWVSLCNFMLDTSTVHLESCAYKVLSIDDLRRLYVFLHQDQRRNSIKRQKDFLKIELIDNYLLQRSK